MKVFIVAAILFVGTVLGGAAQNKDPVCLENNIRALVGKVTFIKSIAECLSTRGISDYDQDVNQLEQGSQNGYAILRAIDACKNDKQCKCKALDKWIENINSLVASTNDLQAKIKEQSNDAALDKCIAAPVKRVNDKIKEVLDCPKQK